MDLLKKYYDSVWPFFFIGNESVKVFSIHIAVADPKINTGSIGIPLISLKPSHLAIHYHNIFLINPCSKK
jgi:hypothetical protein